jgi:hypothetical protein
MISRTTCAEANHATRIAEYYPVERLPVIQDPLRDKLGFRVDIKLRAPFSSQAEILHYPGRVGFVELPAIADEALPKDLNDVLDALTRSSPGNSSGKIKLALWLLIQSVP